MSPEQLLLNWWLKKPGFEKTGDPLTDMVLSAFAGVSDSDLIRSVIFVRDFIGTGIATIRPRITLDWEDLPNAGAGNQIVNVFRPIFVFED